MTKTAHSSVVKDIIFPTDAPAPFTEGVGGDTRPPRGSERPSALEKTRDSERLLSIMQRMLPKGKGGREKAKTWREAPHEASLRSRLPGMPL